MFKQMDLKGKTKDDTVLDSVHQNTISTIRVHAGSGGGVKSISSKFPAKFMKDVTDFLQRVVLMEDL